MWMPECQKAFEDIKERLISNDNVGIFDPKLPTTLLTDASRLGLGYCLLQTQHDGSKRLIGCGSRSLNDPETRWAVSELEGLAVMFLAVRSSRFSGPHRSQTP